MRHSSVYAAIKFGAILHSVKHIKKFETAFDNSGTIPTSNLIQTLVFADFVDAYLYNCISLDSII